MCGQVLLISDPLSKEAQKPKDVFLWSGVKGWSGRSTNDILGGSMSFSSMLAHAGVPRTSINRQGRPGYWVGTPCPSSCLQGGGFHSREQLR